MQPDSLAIIGAGNMGNALLGGLIAKGYPPDRLWVTTRHPEKNSALQKQHGIHVTCNNPEAVHHAQAVVLAVKPQHLPDLAKEIAPAIATSRPLVLSVITGITLASLKDMLGQDIPVVRCMPNTAALISASITALCADSLISDDQRQMAETLMQVVGSTFWVSDEQDMHAVTALSGSGPAYFFYIMQALEKAAPALGIQPSLARRLIVHTLLGAARLASETGLSPLALQQQITSKGGTTEAALSVFDQHGLPDILQAALLAAHTRSVELSHAGAFS